MNTGEPWPLPFWAGQRVRRMQAKLHQWAAEDPGRQFDDLYNLIHHPDFLTVAWERVRGNKGARTPGIDRVIPAFISSPADVTAFLNDTRGQLKARTFTPLPVRERMIPKTGSPGKFRRLGIPSAMDRLVQAALVLVLEPIFEADFKPVSYGFRPKRRAQDAIAEIHAFGSRNYHWVFEADITACFDELSHSAILDRVRLRVGDKRVLALVKSFLKAGIMSEAGQIEGTASGTPQGGIASPLLANIALSVLDEHFCAKDEHGTRWRREAHRKRGGAYYRIIRYADDFAIMVCGSKAHADALWEEVAAVLAPLGLRLSETKTRVCHLDEGFVFLGFRIQRRIKRGTSKKCVYTYPSKKALLSVMAKVRALTNRSRHKTLEDLLRQLNLVLRGWCNYFRHGVSKATFHFLDAYVWRRVTAWLRKRHTGITWKDLYRRFLTGRPGNRPAENGVIMFDTTQGPRWCGCCSRRARTTTGWRCGTPKATSSTSTDFPGAFIALDTFPRRTLDQQRKLAARRGIPARFAWACDDPRSLERLGLRVVESTGLARLPGPVRRQLPARYRFLLPLAEPVLGQAMRVTLLQA